MLQKNTSPTYCSTMAGSETWAIDRTSSSEQVFPPAMKNRLLCPKPDQYAKEIMNKNNIDKDHISNPI